MQKTTIAKCLLRDAGQKRTMTDIRTIGIRDLGAAVPEPALGKAL